VVVVVVPGQMAVVLMQAGVQVVLVDRLLVQLRQINQRVNHLLAQDSEIQVATLLFGVTL
jgi:hypothetical protein